MSRNGYITYLEQRISALEAQVENLTTETLQQATDLDRSNFKLADLQYAHEQLQEEHREKEAALKVAQQANLNYQEALRLKHADYQQLQTKHSDLNVYCNGLQYRNDNQSGSLAVLMQDIKTLREQVVSQEETINTLQSEVSEALRHKAMWKTECEAARANANTMYDELSALQAEATEQYNTCKERIEELENSLVDAVKQPSNEAFWYQKHSHVMQKLDILKAQHEKDTSFLNKENCDLIRGNNKLKAEVVRLEEELQDLKKQHHAILLKQMAASAANTIMRDQNSEQHKTINNLRDELRMVNTDYALLKDEFVSLGKDLDSQRQATDRVAADRDQALRCNKLQYTAMTKLQQQVKALQEQVKSSDDAYQKLKLSVDNQAWKDWY